MEQLMYWFKPYLYFIIGILCIGLDHPVKWVSVILLISVSVAIEFMRYRFRRYDFDKIELTGAPYTYGQFT